MNDSELLQLKINMLESVNRQLKNEIEITKKQAEEMIEQIHKEYQQKINDYIDKIAILSSQLSEVQKGAVEEKIERQRTLPSGYAVESDITKSKTIKPSQMLASKRRASKLFISLPSSTFKGKIKNRLHIKPDMYTILKKRIAKRDDDAFLKEANKISTDIERTYSKEILPKSRDEFNTEIKNMLECFAFFRSDIGYVQGMNYYAAFFALYCNEVEAFINLCNCFNCSLLYNCIAVNDKKIKHYGDILEEMVKEQNQELHQFLKKSNFLYGNFIFENVMTMFKCDFHIKIMKSIWKFILVDIKPRVFIVALAIIVSLREKITQCKPEEILPLLKKPAFYKRIDFIKSYIEKVPLQKQDKYKKISRKLKAPKKLHSSTKGFLSIFAIN